LNDGVAHAVKQGTEVYLIEQKRKVSKINKKWFQIVCHDNSPPFAQMLLCALINFPISGERSPPLVTSAGAVTVQPNCT
jgi:hypothetical protein